MFTDILDDIGAFVAVGLFTACAWVWAGIAAGA